MFAEDHCARCRKHRSTGVARPVEEMRRLLEHARKQATMKAEHSEAAADHEGRLKLIAILSLIVGGMTLFTSYANRVSAGMVIAVVFLAGALLMKLRLGVKLVAVLLALLSLLEVGGRFVNFGPLVAAAGPAALAAAPMWLGSVALFVGIIVMCLKVLVHDPHQNALPPPLPPNPPDLDMPARAPAVAPPSGEQSGDKT